MKLKPKGLKLLVEQQLEKKQDTGGFFIVVEDAKPFYAKGKIISVGEGVVGVDEVVGKVVVYPVEKAKSVGLGLPEGFVIVDIEDVHGFIEE